MTGAQSEASAKPLLRALRGERLRRPPWWLMRQAGRYLPEYRALRAQAHDFVDFCLNPVLAAEATLQPVRRFGMDAAIIFADILLVPRALGQKLSFGDEGPVLDPIGSLRTVVELAAGESREVIFLLGAASGRDAIEAIVASVSRSISA